jgi:6-phospho-3-hexuloisomerase
MEKVKRIAKEMLQNATWSIEQVHKEDVKGMVDILLKAKKIFVLGVGHSGLMGKVFAMKLAHLGFNSYVVGDVTTSALNSGDIMVAISQSGETPTILTLCQKAKKLGGKIITITSFPKSTLSELSDHSVFIRAKSKDIDFAHFSLLGDEEHKNMSGALFGLNIYLFFYGLICELAEVIGQTPKQIDSRHANIE